MKCDEGINGECCCNCRFQEPLYKHPGNVKIGQGSMLDVMGYVCTEPVTTFVFFESEHGMCELYEVKINK